LIGASTGVISGVHIGVDIIVKLLSEKYEFYSRIFANFCGMVLYLFMSYLSLRFVLSRRVTWMLSSIRPERTQYI
jgi:TRAP-type C4-dicarboxylate transport system permease small subunit